MAILIFLRILMDWIGIAFLTMPVGVPIIVGLGIDQRQFLSVYQKGTAALFEQRIAGRTDHYMNKELLNSQLRTLEEPKNGLTISIADDAETIARTLTLKILTHTLHS